MGDGILFVRMDGVEVNITNEFVVWSFGRAVAFFTGIGDKNHRHDY